MDLKNVGALTYGPEYMLGKFANLPDKPGDSKPAEEFLERFGELFPGLDPEKYWVDVADFRNAWHAKSSFEREAVGENLTRLFNRSLRSHVKPLPRNEFGFFDVGILSGNPDPRYFPAMKVDFSSGKVTVSPTGTLLDWLACALVECRRRLGICEREGCTTPYFVKMHPRARYCSEDCFHQSRQRKKTQWWKDNRGKGSGKPVPTHEIRAKRSPKRGRR
jgi:hypothetical protein